MPVWPGMTTSISTTSGFVRSRLEHGLSYVAGLGDDVEVVLLLEQQAQARADDGVVVDDEDADLGFRLAHKTGTSATIVVPPSGCDSTRSSPSISPSRSRMPTSPMPSSSRSDDGSKPAAVVRRSAP